VPIKKPAQKHKAQQQYKYTQKKHKTVKTKTMWYEKQHTRSAGAKP